MSKYEIIKGNSLDVLKTLPANHFHSIITSPPYWQLRDYFCEGQLGMEATPEEFVDSLVAIMHEAKRVLRPDGVMWMVIGDTYSTPKKGNTQDNVNSRLRRDKLHEQGVDKKIPKGMKKKNLLGVPWKVAFGLQDDGWILRCDAIWCLSGGTNIYVRTPNGVKSMNIRNMFRGFHNKMEVWTGSKWTKVLKVHQRPRIGNEMTVTLRSGERFYCSPEHKWITESGEVETKDLQIGDIFKRVRFTEPKNVVSPENLPDDDIGWLIGIYLAEGSKSDKTIQIASHVKELDRYDRLKQISKRYDGTCHRYKTSDNGVTINLHSDILNSIIFKYIQGSNAKNKQLTSDCWNRSNVFLQSLLDGYLEGDGHWEEKNNRWRLGFTRNYNLERDLRILSNRLGYDIRLKMSKSKIGEKEYKTFRGQLRCKKSQHHSNKNSCEVIDIKDTDFGGKNYYYDITVEDSKSIYALSSGILTHNSKTNGMPDGAKDRPTRCHEYVFMFTKEENYFYDHIAVQEKAKTSNVTKRKFGAKDQKGTFRQDQDRYFEDNGMRNKRSVWSIPVASSGGKHFGVFPVKLIEPCVISSASIHGCCSKCGNALKNTKDGKNVSTCDCKSDISNCRVLDPFSGTATTGVVCLGNDIDYTGIELNDEYIEVSKERLDAIDPIFGGM